MKRHLWKVSLYAVWPGLLLAACGGPLEEGEAPTEDLLGTQEAALCSGASVSSLTITSFGTYGGEASGSGTWTVTSPANGIHLDYYIDGIKRGEQDLQGNSSCSGSWAFTYRPVSCGQSHSFELKAYPLSILSTSIDRCQTSDPRRRARPSARRARPTPSPAHAAPRRRSPARGTVPAALVLPTPGSGRGPNRTTPPARSIRAAGTRAS